MAIYTINNLKEGLIENVTSDQIIRFGTGVGGNSEPAVPATETEVHNQIPPATEEKKYITLYNIWKWKEQALKQQITLTSSSFTTVLKNDKNLSQNEKTVIVQNTIPSTITISASSESEFQAIYIKKGAGNLTFVAGTDVDLVLYNGTAIVTENGRACLIRIGSTNTFILYA